jgi:broad specificity phosphatase PhoE
VLNNANAVPKRIFLARHGESLANQQKLISGQLDYPLTEKGKHQAQWLCDVLKDETLSAIYTSSLTRTMETAKPTSEFHGIAIRPMDNLKEIHFGILQGKPSALADQYISLDKTQNIKNLNIPDSEDVQVFENRIIECLNGVLRDLQGTALIVAHRNTNEVILSILLDLSSSTDKAINVKNKYLYEIAFGDTTSINTIRLGGEFHGKKFMGLKDE